MKMIYNKMIALAVLFMASAISASAQKAFKIEDFKIAAGETKTIDLIVSSDEVISNMNVDIYVPDGLSFVGADGSAEFTTHYAGGTKSAKVQTQGKAIGALRFGFNFGSAAAGEAKIASFKVQASETYTGGVLTINNMKIINTVIDPFTVKADLDIPSTPIEGFTFKIQDFSMKPGETKEVDIILSAESDVSNMNIDLYLSDGLSFVGSDGSAVFTDLYAGGTKSAKVQTQGKAIGALRFGFNFGSAAAGEEKLASFKIQASETFSGGKISAKNMKIINTVVTDFDINVGLTTGIENIESNVENNAVVYDLVGRQVNANAKGILIKNGKKFIVK